MQENVLLAFGLTLFAGLATGIGSCLAFFTKKTNKKFLSISLGFSAGVMVYVSFVEIFVKGKTALVLTLGEQQGYYLAVLFFFVGILISAFIDKIVPKNENPHELKLVEDIDNKDVRKAAKLMRMGVFSALAIGLHNFPEGLATFIATLNDPSVGIAIAIAVAIHNVPEGIAVSVPIYYATGSKLKAFYYSFLSGLAEPIGALIGYLFLMPYLNETTFGLVFMSVAGIMIYISMDELLPAAREYGEHHYSISGFIAGMMVMSVSLLLFV